MNKATSLKSNKNASPKTPGGISKSLLTPCRRLGLSRNWKKGGVSPFISPLSGSNSSSVEVKAEKRESRKRKERVPDEEVENGSEETTETAVEIDGIDESDVSAPAAERNEIVGTPSRLTAVPRKKKSKLLSVLDNCNQNTAVLQNKEVNDNGCTNDLPKEETTVAEKPTVSTVAAVLTPVRAKSNFKGKKHTSPIKPISSKNNIKQIVGYTDSERNENVSDTLNLRPEDSKEKTKNISPNELTKECIVVIQKKIFKTDKKKHNKDEERDTKELNKSVSQADDSDSDERPLCHLNKIENIQSAKVDTEIIIIDDDDNFTATTNVKVKKLADKNTSTGGLKTPTKKKATKKLLKTKKLVNVQVDPKSSQSSNSFDEDEDFDFESKKTILIRKTYDKVTKPSRAKSTGSITQKDIEDIRARIETKKKLLLAKAMTEDTEELRGLIKKWQKGCQDALMELMELMKNKFPDKQNMDYSDMLQMLRIPTALVGYDSDNECFNTPDDASIVLSKLNDL